MTKQADQTPLLQCPFCGKKPKKHKESERYGFLCSGGEPNPHAIGTNPFGFETEDEARQAWNRMVKKAIITDAAIDDALQNN